jgi:hypothetical protein
MLKSPQLPKDENDVMRRQHELAQELERHDVMLRLADLARVPKIKKARQHFSRVILDLLFDAWENDDLRDHSGMRAAAVPGLGKGNRVRHRP